MTVNWIGTDQKDRFISNLTDLTSKQRLISSGWNENSVIKYKLNSHAFRCPEFNKDLKIIALGCSFTFGVGLHNHQVWPSLLESELQQPVYNMATGSASLDTCYRVLENYLPHINASCVILCEPDPTRFEIWQQDIVYSNNNNYLDQNFTKFWNSSTNNLFYNRKKNIESMKYVCNLHNVKFINFTKEQASKTYYQDDPDESRCLIHLGPKSQKKIFKYVLDLYLKNI